MEAGLKRSAVMAIGTSPQTAVSLNLLSMPARQQARSARSSHDTRRNTAPTAGRSAGAVRGRPTASRRAKSSVSRTQNTGRRNPRTDTAAANTNGAGRRPKRSARPPVTALARATPAYPENSLIPRASPRSRGPTRSILLVTVIVQAKAWLAPRRRLAATTHAQFGAARRSQGTGSPTAHPASNTRRRPNRSARWPASKLSGPFTTPKAAMKDSNTTKEVTWKVCRPSSGTTARSLPTSMPTNTLSSASSANWARLGARPSRGGGAVLPCGTLRPAEVGGPDRVGVLRARRDVLPQERDELGPRPGPEAGVVPPFEAERGDRMSAQSSPAHRAGEGSRVDQEVVGEREQAREAVVERCGPGVQIARQLDPSDVADHQRVAREEQPGVRAAGPVSDQEAEVLRRVPGSVEDLELDVAQRDRIPVLRPPEGEPGRGAGVQEVVATGRARQIPPGGQVVGVGVGIRDAHDPQPEGPRGVQIGGRGADGIDDGRDPVASAPDEVGGGHHRLGVQELSQDHDGPSCRMS